MNFCLRSAVVALILAAPAATQAAQAAPAACPPELTRIVRSAGGVIDYHGTVPGIPELCRVTRADGAGEFYFGVWRSDWPGAGQAYPALHAVLMGPEGTHASFITRSVPGLQWTDTLTNGGMETLTIDGHRYQALRLAHEREGIEGNTYHSVITSWRDVLTGMALQTVERQIAGQSYGPATTWHAVKVETLP